MQSKSENAASASGSALTNAAILLTLTLVTMLYAMTVTIANVSLPQIKGTLSATTDEIALIITFNIIATAFCKLSTCVKGSFYVKVTYPKIHSGTFDDK